MLDNIGAALRDGMSLVAQFVPKLLLFLAILVVGWLIARVLRKLAGTLLKKVGFDRAVERGGLARENLDATDLVARLVYYAVLLITLQIAFGAFGPNPVSDLLNQIVAFLPRIAVAVIIVVIAAAIANAVKDLVSSAMGGLSYSRVVANIAWAFVIGLGVIAALSQIGIALAVTMPVLITVLATVGGILVVGVGGGLIGPMRQRWERVLTRAEEEGPQARAQAEAFRRGREDAGRAQAAEREPDTAPVPEVTSPREGAPPAG